MLRFRLPLLATLCLAGCSLNPKGELPGAANSTESDPTHVFGDDDVNASEMEPGSVPGATGPEGQQPSPGLTPPAMTANPSTPVLPDPSVPVDLGPDDDVSGPDDDRDGGPEPFDAGPEPEPLPDGGSDLDGGVPGDAGPEADANAP